MKKGEGTWLDTSQAGIGNVKPTCSVDPLQHVATEMLQAQGNNSLQCDSAESVVLKFSRLKG